MRWLQCHWSENLFAHMSGQEAMTFRCWSRVQSICKHMITYIDRWRNGWSIHIIDKMTQYSLVEYKMFCNVCTYEAPASAMIKRMLYFFASENCRGSGSSSSDERFFPNFHHGLFFTAVATSRDSGLSWITIDAGPGPSLSDLISCVDDNVFSFSSLFWFALAADMLFISNSVCFSVVTDIARWRRKWEATKKAGLYKHAEQSFL